jgi:hypothetical protein
LWSDQVVALVDLPLLKVVSLFSLFVTRREEAKRAEAARMAAEEVRRQQEAVAREL